MLWSLLGTLLCTYAPEVAKRSAAATAIDEKVAGNSSPVEAAAAEEDANAADLRGRLRPAASRRAECRAASVAPALNMIVATIPFDVDRREV